MFNKCCFFPSNTSLADEKDAESVPPIAVVVEDAADESELYNDIGDDDASILYRNIAGTATIDESESDGEEG